ncbi:hypothetical protein PINS_up022480, partial [Pythium insidiosum]
RSPTTASRRSPEHLPFVTARGDTVDWSLARMARSSSSRLQQKTIQQSAALRASVRLPRIPGPSCSGVMATREDRDSGCRTAFRLRVPLLST